MIFYPIWLTETQSTNECLIFQSTKTRTKNNCSFVNEHEQLSNQIYDDSCLICSILEINEMFKRNCEKSLTCIKLFFDHNLIFEEFFKKYRPIIEDLYINDMNHLQNSTLSVHIKHYNLTEIDFNYLNSTFNINSPPYKILKIEFNQKEQELKPLRIVNNFSLMTNSNVIITVPCNASNQTIDYRIQSGKMTTTKSIACQLSQSNNLTVSIVNINLTTSLPSQSSSSLLYLFLIFFIITICVIIASIWSFFRKNTHHDIDDEHLTVEHKVTNTDKYGVTDKDSKSATSWSHGSALLLSPLVK